MANRKVTAKAPPRDPRNVALDPLGRKPFVSSGEIARITGLTRQAVHQQLRAMVDAGELFPEGAGRGARYVRRRTALRLRRDRDGLDESMLYRELEEGLPALRDLPARASRVLHYVFTEMVNNAVDHSRAAHVEVEVRMVDESVHVEISDDGIGAFENVRAGLGLGAPIEAIGEISKGKTTTDPERHSGQGLFFSSKAVQLFELECNGLRWVVDDRRGDNAIGGSELRTGTRVRFEIDRDTDVDLRRLFDEYTTDFEFDRSRTMVRLFAYGTSFVSRSEAKRLVHGLERFREVVLDFAGVELVGQGFVDEVFRVWARAHAGTALVPVNMIEPVAFMVRRGRA